MSDKNKLPGIKKYPSLKEAIKSVSNTLSQIHNDTTLEIRKKVEKQKGS